MVSKKSKTNEKRRLLPFTLATTCDVERFSTRAQEDIYSGSLDEAACAELAERFGLLDVGPVAVSLKVKMIAKETWEVTGRIEAELKQACVVTSKPVYEAVSIEIEERYVPVIDEDNSDVEINVASVDVELLEEGIIPLGELVQQSLGLGVNSHPRSPDAPDDYQAGPEIKTENPFQKLSQLKK